MPDLAEKLLYVLESQEFEKFYKHYILPILLKGGEENKSKDILELYLEKIKVPECHIAILGVQGSGKSSLLNALLFGETVLPVEVQETTCIPTMVRRVYSEEEPGAEVHYKDGRVENVPLKVEFLEKVVDNRYNPGNIMDADYVVCRVNNPFLKEGFVFVDLPGVGSLTEKNEETTIRFLQNTNVGIFLLRTVPPITDSEAGFIRVAWPRLQDAIFVQNLWARETESEIEEGIEHNKRVLEKIAQERNTMPPAIILAVNIAMAGEGASKGDAALIEKSGIKEIKKHVKLYASRSFVATLYQQTAKFFMRLINKAQEQIEERLFILQGDRKELEKKLDEAERLFAQNRQELEDRVVQHCENFLDNISSMKTDWLSEKLEEASNHATEKIDKLPIEDLKEDDFRQSVREIFGEAFTIVYKQVRERLGILAEEHVSNLGKSLEQIASSDQILQQSFSAQPSKPKNAGGWSIALAGSIAPFVLTTGPVGWGIFGGAVLAGSMVRWISGATAHKRIMRGVKTAVNDSKRQVRKEIVTEIEHFAENVVNAIKESIRYDLDACSSELEKIKEDIKNQEVGQQEQKEGLQYDLRLSKTFMGELKQVTLNQ